MNQTIKEFLKGTKHTYHVEISQGTNDNIVYSGTYAELKKQRKDLLTEIVTSYDVVEMADDTLNIGIMI